MVQFCLPSGVCFGQGPHHAGTYYDSLCIEKLTCGEDDALVIPLRYPRYNVVLAFSLYFEYVSYSCSNTSWKASNFTHLRRFSFLQIHILRHEEFDPEEVPCILTTSGSGSLQISCSEKGNDLGRELLNISLFQSLAYIWTGDVPIIVHNYAKSR